MSCSAILDYFDSICVLIQARIRRDLLDRELYYHNRPLPLTKKYRGVRLTEDFEAIVAETVRDFHGIGLFTSEKSRIRKPEMLRTLVLFFRRRSINGSRATQAYEFVFVHGGEKGGELEPHVFVTTKNRASLSYLRPSAAAPNSTRTTSILGRVSVTDFDRTGLYPKESAIRSYRLQTSEQFEWLKLDDYCTREGWDGRFTSNVDRILAAIVGGKYSAVFE